MMTTSRCPLSDTTSRAGEQSPARPSAPSIFDAVRHISSLDAAERAGLAPKRRGDKAWLCCPFHGEKTASLCLYGDASRGWVCFGCQKGGDAVNLYSELYTVTKLDAARKLAQDFGIDVPDASVRHRRAKPQPTIQNLRRALENRRNQDFHRLCQAHHEAKMICEQYNDDAAWDDPKFVAALKIQTMTDRELDFLQQAAVPELAQYYHTEVMNNRST